LYNRSKILALAVLLCLPLGLLSLPQGITEEISKEPATFIISSWDYPDEYGQGIWGMKFWENSTGAWVDAPYYTDIGQFYYVSPGITDYTYNLSIGVALKMRVDCLLNNTLVGADDLADGQNYLRHSVTVTCAGITIFSQQNFTYESSGDIGAPMYYYEYYVILNFLTQAGNIYVVTVTYEVFY